MIYIPPQQKSMAFGSESSARVGFESTLWTIADKLRGHIEVSQYKHLILGLIFLRYLSTSPTTSVQIPKEARWESLKLQSEKEGFGRAIERAMLSLESRNPELRGMLPKEYGKAQIANDKLAEIFSLLNDLRFFSTDNDSRDVLGRVYEYFLGQFARAEGGKGGEFYTPSCVVRLLVEMIAPYRGRVYDPCCGSGGMFVQSQRFVEAHGGNLADIYIFGQESNQTTWRLAKMNLFVRGLRGDLGDESADSFSKDLHHKLLADYILANPPFNMKDWGSKSLRTDTRWVYGCPPENNANYAWVQHILFHLQDHGIAGFVLANGALTSNSGGEAGIRQGIVDSDLVDCIVALPTQLFYTTQIAASLWFLAKDKNGGMGTQGRRLRDRRGKTLFIDARQLGYMVDRVHRELTESEITMIASAYHNWRGDGDRQYSDIAGFSRSVSTQQIREHRYALVPGRYVGFQESARPNVKVEEIRKELEEIQNLVGEVNRAAGESVEILRRFVNG